MAETLDLKTVVKHLANGSFNDSLCVVCLLPFTDDIPENIFTAICKKDEEYCIADVLKHVCHLEIQDTDYYKICLDCFRSASIAYKFYLQAKKSFEVLNFYTDQLLASTEDLEIPRNTCLLCIPLPSFTPETPDFDFGLDGIGQQNMGDDEFEYVDSISHVEEVILIVENENLDEDVKIADEMNSGCEDDKDDNVLMIVNKKKRKKRDPMVPHSCMHCPVKYRFLSKLKDHLKTKHGVDMFYCKICKLIITGNKADYTQHIQTHSGVHQCIECPALFRRLDPLLAHQKGHEQERLKKLTSGNMCEICGVVFPDADSLAAHASQHERGHTCYYCGRMYKSRSSFERHIKAHEKLLKNKAKSSYNMALICYYCGRMYKSQTSFDRHIKKHEALLKNKNKRQIKDSELESTTSNNEEESNSKQLICSVCGKSLATERGLIWHQRLHNDDKPFVCDICGRGFVTVNRRNQHAICSHSKPSRRCPLCPALFHLRSMVNTHLKKVHLNKQQKRHRNRAVKHPNVFWKTEPVPIQELSVSIQNELFEMQTELNIDWKNLEKQPVENKPPILDKKPRNPPKEDPKHLYTPLDVNEDLTDDDDDMIEEQIEIDDEFDEDMI